MVAAYSELAYSKGVKPLSLAFGRDSKTGSGMGKLYSSKKRRLQVCLFGSRFYGEAVGRPVRIRTSCDWLGVHFCFFLLLLS